MYNVAYAPGQGVVPFVYASESFPLYMRTLGMSFSTATTWLFSFSLTLALPSQLASMTPTGTFCFYSAWCLVGAMLAYFFVPETRGLSLEELDFVFAMPIKVHGASKLHQLRHWLHMSPDKPRDIRELGRELFAPVAANVQLDEKMAGSCASEDAKIEHV